MGKKIRNKKILLQDHKKQNLSQDLQVVLNKRERRKRKNKIKDKKRGNQPENRKIPATCHPLKLYLFPINSGKLTMIMSVSKKDR